MSPWHIEIVNRLREHVTDGKTAKQISVALSAEFHHEFTRNSVLGKALRAGMQIMSIYAIDRQQRRHTRVTCRKVKAPNRVPKVDKPPIVRPPLIPPAPVELDDLAIPPAQRRTIVELENHHCRWPIGEPGAPVFFFCGAPTADLAHARPYCAGHARRAYHSSTPASERAHARMSRLGHWAAARAAE